MSVLPAVVKLLQKVEEIRTMIDGEGNQQTIVTRTVDGQTIRQTTKKHKNGATEITEDMINMNEGEHCRRIEWVIVCCGVQSFIPVKRG